MTPLGDTQMDLRHVRGGPGPRTHTPRRAMEKTTGPTVLGPGTPKAPESSELNLAHSRSGLCRGLWRGCDSLRT